MLSRFLSLFESNCAGHLEGLRRAIETGTSDQVRIQAHTIKGAAANIAAHKMKATASALEGMALDGHRDDWLKCVIQLETEFKEFNAVTVAIQDSNKPGL